MPVIRDADRLTVSELSAQATALALRARAGKLLPEEMTGGLFTVSNLGSTGVDTFKAIINPPESGILAVGAIKPRPVALNGMVVVRQTMWLTLSVDHRVVDVALAAEFLANVVTRLEDAWALML